jgi:hypothetical protein
MSFAIRWRARERSLITRWRGPSGMIEALTRAPLLPLAAIVGPPGPPGPQGAAGAGSAPLRLDASSASTWILAHPLGRVPTVQVFLASGEAVLSDVVATTTQITVTFPSPQAGFVLAF